MKQGTVIKLGKSLAGRWRSAGELYNYGGTWFTHMRVYEPGSAVKDPLLVYSQVKCNVMIEIL